MDKTGISRATLNNYINSGVVPKPDVLPPGPEHGDAPRIGYFPDDVLQRIAEIQRLKAQGWSMQRIVEHFRAAADAPVVARAVPNVADTAAIQNALAGSATAVAPSVGRPATPDNTPLRVEGGAAPRLMPMAVLVTNLDQPRRIWAELPPEEYFELINQVWLATSPIIKRYRGVQGKHVSDGMACYFLPQPDSNYLMNALEAALEMQDRMRRISKDWQLRKRWSTELCLSTGIDEGHEWLGTLKSGTDPEFTVLAKAIRNAGRISDLARGGAVWVSKNLISKLGPHERIKLRFGVRRRNLAGDEVFVLSVFSKEAGDAAPSTLKDFSDSGLPPLTEILEIAPGREQR